MYYDKYNRYFTKIVKITPDGYIYDKRGNLIHIDYAKRLHLFGLGDNYDGNEKTRERKE